MQRVRKLIARAALGSTMLLAACARNQGEARPAAAITAREPIFNGLGTHHRSITTSSPEAQRYFDQGMRLMFAYNHDEAHRSFREAQRLDPACASCFWADSLALGPNLYFTLNAPRAGLAWDLLQRAVALEDDATPVERMLIEALRKRYTMPATANLLARNELDKAYALAMREVARTFPDDADVQVLFAEALMDIKPWDYWKNDGTPQEGTVEAVRTLDRALEMDANHPAANHLYAHLLEGSLHPENALTAASRLPALMPGAGHLVHTPAHVYMRLGRYEEAAEASRRALQADKTYAAVAPSMGIYELFMAHHAISLAAAATWEGRRGEAVEASHAALPHMPVEMLRAMAGFDYQLPIAALTRVRFGQWQAVLNEPAPPADLKIGNALWHYAQGRAYVGMGKLDDAAREQAQVETIAKALPADARAGLNRGSDVLRIAMLVLSGKRAERESRWDDAVAALEEAVRVADSLHYDQPSDWHYPPRQALGAVLLAAGKPVEAELVYREDLKRNPDNGWSLFGLAQSLLAQKRAPEAGDVDSRFQVAWSHADVTLHASDF